VPRTVRTTWLARVTAVLSHAWPLSIHDPTRSDMQDGGGVYVASARLELRDTTLSACEARHGGALASIASIVTLHDSSMSNCYAAFVS
jgi:hypothetical protein